MLSVFLRAFLQTIILGYGKLSIVFFFFNSELGYNSDYNKNYKF